MMTDQDPNRIGVVSVIVTGRQEQAQNINAILSDYGDIIIGRMGLPYPPKKINIILC